MKLIRDNPRDGWVRGNFAITAETQTEIAELRAQVAELRQSKAESERAAPAIADLAIGDDPYRFKHSVLGHTAEDEDQPSYLRQRYIWSVSFDTTWNQILQAIGPRLLNETTQNDLHAAITDYGRSLWAARSTDDWPETLAEVSETRADPATLEDIRIQLWAQGMIEHGSKRRQISDKNTYWVLTQAGQDQLMKLRALRKPTSEFEQPDAPEESDPEEGDA
jgi:Lhr-like helicase